MSLRCTAASSPGARQQQGPHPLSGEVEAPHAHMPKLLPKYAGRAPCNMPNRAASSSQHVQRACRDGHSMGLQSLCCSALPCHMTSGLASLCPTSLSPPPTHLALQTLQQLRLQTAPDVICLSSSSEPQLQEACREALAGLPGDQQQTAVQLERPSLFSHARVS